jgi:hypothetical protein
MGNEGSAPRFFKHWQEEQAAFLFKVGKIPSSI